MITNEVLSFQLLRQMTIVSERNPGIFSNVDNLVIFNQKTQNKALETFATFEF